MGFGVSDFATHVSLFSSSSFKNLEYDSGLRSTTLKPSEAMLAQGIHSGIEVAPILRSVREVLTLSRSKSSRPTRLLQTDPGRLSVSQLSSSTASTKLS